VPEVSTSETPSCTVTSATVESPGVPSRSQEPLQVVARDDPGSGLTGAVALGIVLHGYGEGAVLALIRRRVGRLQQWIPQG
jgi:hypothetical protein